MPTHRRSLLAHAAALVISAGLAGSGPALAAPNDAGDYPNRPVRLVVSYGAGGSLDAMARLLGQELGKLLGPAFVVENIAGAGGTIGVKRVISAAPDGYTLLMGITSDVALAPLTNATARYQASDLAPVANIGTSGIVLVGRPDLPAGNLAELLELARARPGKISYGTSGHGSLPHVVMENIKERAKVDIPLVPYKSASNITTDVLGGHLDLAIVGLPALLPMIEKNKVKALAVMSAKRDIGNPSIPAAGEVPQLRGIDFAFWTGMFAPKGTPQAIVEKLHDAVARVLAQPAVAEQFARMGVEIAPPHSVRDFSAYVVQSQRQLADAVARGKVAASSQ